MQGPTENRPGGVMTLQTRTLVPLGSGEAWIASLMSGAGGVTHTVPTSHGSAGSRNWHASS